VAITSFPFDSQTSTESDWSHIFRYLTTIPGGGVVGAPDGTALKVTGDSTGMNVKVAAGTGIVRGHMIINDATATVTITAANASNPRIDSIVANLDPSANSITLIAVAGTAAATPVAPTLTQTDAAVWQMKLADVYVAANATSISAGNVTDARTFAGNDLGVWTTSNRPTGSTGLAGFNTSTGLLEAYNGTAWVSFMKSGDAIIASQISSGEQLNLNVGKINSAPIFVQSTAPTSPASNTIWLWGA
jgi:hypothetical protein